MTKYLDKYIESKNTESVDPIVEQYKIAWDLWKHADLLRQSRQTNYITLNSIMFAAIAALPSIAKGNQPIALVALFLGVFAISVDAVWLITMKRNTDFQSFFRHQIVELELKYGVFEIGKNYVSALYEKREFTFLESKKIYSIDKKYPAIANAGIENILPKSFILIWIIITAGAVLFLVTHTLNRCL